MSARELDLPEFLDLIEMPDVQRKRIMRISSAPHEEEVEKLVFRLFVFAVAHKASDVHITGRDYGAGMEIRVNIRLHGMLYHWRYTGKNPKHFQEKLFNLANIGSGTHGETVSSRFRMNFPVEWATSYGLVSQDEQYLIDVRLQYQTTADGYTCVCRILDPQRAPTLDELGLSFALHREMIKVLNKPDGMIIVTGPTGSGKSTLMNAMISYLNDGSRVIVTVEDPKELTIKGQAPVSQIEVRGRLTFSEALRSAMRLDPDIIMIGEIRDEETMSAALKAAESGHLVFATLHTEDAVGAFTRSLDLCPDKVRDAARLAKSIKMVIAQRLIDSYQGDLAQRPLDLYEKDLLQTNGIIPPDQIFETTATEFSGKLPVIEAICMTHEIMREITPQQVNSENIFKIASHQLQYESQVLRGLRYVESGMCRLDQCEKNLHTNSYAMTHTPLRSKLVMQYGLTYEAVAQAIDQMYLLRSQNIECDLTDQLLAIAKQMNQTKEDDLHEQIFHLA